MNTLLGLAAIYAWTHSAVIIFKKTKDTTGYEQGILIAGAVGFILFIIGALK